jgi:hypothetical protein
MLTGVRTGQALSVSQNVYEEIRTTVRTEAAQFGINSLDSCYSGLTSSDANFLELIRYRKSLLDNVLLELPADSRFR